jgi:uncharacterized protein
MSRREPIAPGLVTLASRSVERRLFNFPAMIASRAFTALALAIGVCAGMASHAGAAAATRDGAPHVNRLAQSSSPYLLSHANHPVDWYPWGPEALAKAKRENKPIFVSVGYSTCYWCHVAARTIYAKPEFAKVMNAAFVNIKVDREQRPDLDRIYMLATQLMTGRGGWPNNLFLTPDLKPFFAGSYFPPHDDEFGRTGFSTILATISEVWASDRRPFVEIAGRVHAALEDHQRRAAGAAPRAVDPEALIADAVRTFAARADRRHGGIGMDGPSRFPRAPALELLLADYRIRRDPAVLEAVTGALDAMAYGGIYDHLGGGFHRYTIEPSWSVPHFEKMLYDNAQMLKLYASAFAVTGRPLYRHVATDVAAYLMREMMAPAGGFYTAQDAEVDGREGASYVWLKPEIDTILGARARKFHDVYALALLPAPPVGESADLRLLGEQEGVIRVRLPIVETLRAAKSTNMVSLISSLRAERDELLVVRNRRKQPLRDEKIIIAQNGLAIEAFAEAGRLLGRPDYVAAARRSADYLWTVAFDTGRQSLKHEVFRGRALTEGYLDDYALLARGYMALYAATGEPVWLGRAQSLADAMLKRFAQADGTFFTSTSRADLLIAPIDDGDTAYPSGTSAAVELLLRLAAAGRGPRYAAAARNAVERVGGRIAQLPAGWSTMVAALNASRFDPRVAAPGGAGAAGPLVEAPAEFRLPTTADRVKVSVTIEPAGDRYRIAVRLDIERGFHVNANPASYDYLIATSVSFEGVTPLAVTYPEPVLFKPIFARDGIKVYEGSPNVIATIARKDLPAGRTVRGTVSVQACDDQACLPPSRLPITAAPVE